jgi:tRNA pseudouridine38-40 synthase
MVRRLVGALVELGAGALAPAELERLLARGPAPRSASDPKPAEWTAPPSGLFLERVIYRGDPPPGELRAVTPIG